MNIVIATLHVRRSAQAVPLAAACLAAALPEGLRRQAFLVDLFPDQSLPEMLEQILAYDPELVAFPTYVWNRDQIRDLSQALHQTHPDLHLVAGGPEATGDHLNFAQQAPWLKILRGEGEFVFPHLVAALAKQRPFDTLPGLTWHDKGQLQSTPEQPPSHGWAELPSPWLTKVLDPTASEGVLWEISRGCSFSCDYCFDARGKSGLAPLDQKRLEAELDLFVAAGVSQIWLLDSTFNFPQERGRALAKLLRAKAPHIHFHIEAKAEFLDRETAHLLSELSCSVQFGLQSSNPDALRAVHRSFNLEQFTKHIQRLNAEGVIYGFDLIYGLPNDNHTSFRDSLDLALQLAPNHVHIFPLAVLPGTRLAADAKSHGLHASPTPPYEIISSASWSEDDLLKSRRLAAAVDLFYNTGRAVAFFPVLLQLFQETPCDFLDHFEEWTRQNHAYDLTAAKVASTSTQQVDGLYREYLTSRLQSTGKSHLATALLDLLNYHFHYAETLLGTPVQPQDPSPLKSLDLWHTCWQTSPHVRLIPFRYEIVDLMEMEEFDLETFVELFRPVGSVGLFLRRNDEVFCESLTEDFYQLLRSCDGQKTPQEIFEGALPRAAVEELVSFAVTEGLLQRSPGE